MLKHQSAQLHATSKRLFAGQDYLTQVPCNISDEHVSCTAPATRKASLQTPTHAIFFEHATKPTCLPHFWEGAESIAPARQNDFHILTSKMCFPLQRCALFRHQLPKVIWTRGVLTFLLPNVLRAATACAFWTSQLPKVIREWCVSSKLTSTRASLHNAVHFWTSQLPRMVCFVRFDFHMCFAPQPRALFRHLNFQTCSKNGVLLAFWLRNFAPQQRAIFDLSSDQMAPHPPL